MPIMMTGYAYPMTREICAELNSVYLMLPCKYIDNFHMCLLSLASLSQVADGLLWHPVDVIAIGLNSETEDKSSDLKKILYMPLTL